MVAESKILLSNILNRGVNFLYEKMHFEQSGAVNTEFWIYPHWNRKKLIVLTRVLDRISINTGFTLKQNEHNAKLFSLYYDILFGRQSLAWSECEQYKSRRCRCCFDVQISFIQKNKPHEVMNERVHAELGDFESFIFKELSSEIDRSRKDPRKNGQGYLLESID